MRIFANRSTKCVLQSWLHAIVGLGNTCLVLLLAIVAWPELSFAVDHRPNILFIAVDDLRPQLGCYGQAQVKSPNIDRLASQGMTFNRAYCMVPTCGASRASLMTSIRPAPKRFVTHLAYAEKDAPGITTLHAHLKQNGYYTVSNGKILHHPEDSAGGWSEPAWRPGQPAPGLPPMKKPRGNKSATKSDEDGNARSAPFEISERDDDELGDGRLALKTISDLQRLKEQGQPFFLAAGFFKPHLPFIAPKKYWDLYPAESISLPKNYFPPKDAPAEAIHNSGELRAYEGVPKEGRLPDELALSLIRGYHACVSFTDAQIGRVLDELDRLDLAKNTIVILWGDHGWNLAEHTLWCKHSCFETSLRVPLIIRVPGIQGGLKTEALTELIDIYPSLCELTGVPIPSHVQGRSFVPLLKNPSLPWKEQAISRFMAGDTIRTANQRLTEYSDRKGQPTARMRYDHNEDPEENINVSERADGTEINEQLTERLRSGKGKDGDLPRP
jgi:iduronate 2-sulfatase